MGDKEGRIFHSMFWQAPITKLAITGLWDSHTAHRTVSSHLIREINKYRDCIWTRPLNLYSLHYNTVVTFQGKGTSPWLSNCISEVLRIQETLWSWTLFKVSTWSNHRYLRGSGDSAQTELWGVGYIQLCTRTTTMYVCMNIIHNQAAHLCVKYWMALNPFQCIINLLCWTWVPVLSLLW